MKRGSSYDNHKYTNEGVEGPILITEGVVRLSYTKYGLREDSILSKINIPVLTQNVI